MTLGIRRIILPFVLAAGVATLTACGNDKSKTSNMPTTTSTDTFTHSTEVADHFIFRMMESADVKQEHKIAPAIKNHKTAGNFILDLMTFADTTSVKNILRKK